jgi:hypothetical protein
VPKNYKGSSLDAFFSDSETTITKTGHGTTAPESAAKKDSAAKDKRSNTFVRSLQFVFLVY